MLKNSQGFLRVWELACKRVFTRVGLANEADPPFRSDPFTLVAPDLIRGPVTSEGGQDAGSRVKPGTTGKRSGGTGIGQQAALRVWEPALPAMIEPAKPEIIACSQQPG